MKSAWVLGTALWAWSAFGTAPFPAANFPYFGKIQISNQKVAKASEVKALHDEAVEGCRIIHRSLFAVENYGKEIRELIGSKGANFPVLYANTDFYRKHLERRLNACTGGTIKLNLYGRCGTAQQTLAFVKVTLGFVHSTINVCEEFFADSSSTRVSTLVHEYGRLENIGDSPNFDTNNIYVWDAIVGRLGDPATFAQLAELKKKNGG